MIEYNQSIETMDYSFYLVRPSEILWDAESGAKLGVEPGAEPGVEFERKEGISRIIPVRASKKPSRRFTDDSACGLSHSNPRPH
jgi:hypothetical protein